VYKAVYKAATSAQHVAFQIATPFSRSLHIVRIISDCRMANERSAGHRFVHISIQVSKQLLSARFRPQLSITRMPGTLPHLLDSENAFSVAAMNEQIAKLEAEVEALSNLTIRASKRFIFLRPMLANQELLDRIGKEEKAVGFRRLRNWLYWGLVQELSNICSDEDKRKRSFSIKTVTRKLKDVQLRNHLEEKWLKKLS
jgi:hypothetical protein